MADPVNDDSVSSNAFSKERTPASVADWKALCSLAKTYADKTVKAQECSSRYSVRESSYSSSVKLIHQYIPLFPSAEIQVKLYLDCLSDTDMNEVSISKSRAPAHHALVFLRLCMLPQWNSSDSSPNGPSSPLFLAQIAATQCDLHVTLVKLLCCPNADTRCRSQASKVLCNLVTTNWITSQTLIGVLSTSSCSLFDIISITAIAPPSHQNRKILAQVVATIHNSVAALEKTKESMTLAVDFCEKIAKNRLLISKLLSNLLPTHASEERHCTLIESNSRRKSTRQDEDTQRHAITATTTNEDDSAAEWILRLLMGKLVIQYDLLPLIYKSLGNRGDDEPMTTTSDQMSFLNSLLCYWQDCYEEAVCYYTYFRSWRASLTFLDNQSMKLGRSILSKIDGDGDTASTACIGMLQILAAALVETKETRDNSDTMSASIRFFICHETSLVSDICIELASIIDQVTMANQGKRMREMRMSNYHQKIINVHIQFLANVSYRCKDIQDLLRQVMVAPERTGLHIIMSCTSVSHACFGIREWAVVAMRNLLEDNFENQQLLEMLAPQEAINSDALASLGFGIDLDGRGHVQVVPPRPNNINE